MAYFWIFGSVAAAVTLAVDLAFRKERAQRQAMLEVTSWMVGQEQVLDELSRQRCQLAPELVMELGVRRLG